MTITITTWNVQNFSQNSDEFADKLDYLAGTLEALGAEIVALQEILDTEALHDLADRLGFNHFAADPDGRGNRVGFLTRNAIVGQPRQIDQWQLPPAEEVRALSNSGEIVVNAEFPRPALQITVSHNGGQVDIITAHMKSKLLTFSGGFSTTDESLRAQTGYFALQRRAAEATSIREHVTGIFAAGRDVIVLGDFNDVHEAATTQLLFGPSGSQPRGPEDATRTSSAFQRSDNGDPRRLFNVTRLIEEQVRWSRKHNGQKELLDHILASEGLMPRDENGLRQVPTLSILNEDTPNLIGTNPTLGGVIPDHAPVTATFV